MSIQHHETLDSTNSQVARLLPDQAPEGLWVLADRQTAGRGRQGRPWTSRTGNLHASTAVHLRPDDPNAATLSFVAAVALHRALIDATPIRATSLKLKWPNDLLASRDGQWGKISGILLERVGNAVIVGVGVNLAYAPDIGRPVAKVADFGLPPVPRDLAHVLEEIFADEIDRWRSGGFASTRRRWLDRAHGIGAPLSVHLSADNLVRGTFDGMDADGALLLRTESGAVEVIRAGDVDVA